MALSPRLDQRQTQTFMMTPQLQQAIKLLQLSNLELNVFIDHELEKNPLLELEDPDGGGVAWRRRSPKRPMTGAAKTPPMMGRTNPIQSN